MERENRIKFQQLQDTLNMESRLAVEEFLKRKKFTLAGFSSAGSPIFLEESGMAFVLDPFQVKIRELTENEIESLR